MPFEVSLCAGLAGGLELGLGFGVEIEVDGADAERVDVHGAMPVADLQVAALLRRVPVFNELSPPELDRLQQEIVEEHHAEGTTVVRWGDDGDAMYLIRSGRCGVRRGDRLLAELDPGDYFGEVALMVDTTRTASVETLEETNLLRIPAETFRTVLLANFHSALRLEQGCADRLDAMLG